MLGQYVSDHPLLGLEGALRRVADRSVREVLDAVSAGGFVADGSAVALGAVTTGGVVTGLSSRYTKRGERMATFTLEDLDAAVDVMVFPKTMTEYGGLLQEDAVVVVRGRLDTREEQPKLIAMEITRHDLAPVDPSAPVEVTLPIHRLTDSMVRQLKELVADHPGPCPVHLRVGEKVLRLPVQFNVESKGGIIGALKELFGTSAVVT
jgi:DNA polymerase-3 subunit alpha